MGMVFSINEMTTRRYNQITRNNKLTGIKEYGHLDPEKVNKIETKARKSYADAYRALEMQNGGIAEVFNPKCRTVEENNQ